MIVQGQLISDTLSLLQQKYRRMPLDPGIPKISRTENNGERKREKETRT
jgi:hypothetical protein